MGQKKKKIEIFIRSSRKTSFSGIRFGKNLDPTTQSIADTMGLIQQTERDLSSGTGLYFNLNDRAFALRLKSIAEEFDCEYEFIDVATRKIIDLDMVTTTVLGKMEFDWHDKEVLAPALRIGRHVLSLRGKDRPTDDKIREFVRKRTGSK
jgi:hypothetical protein